jgi:hypothetical protein
MDPKPRLQKFSMDYHPDIITLPLTRHIDVATTPKDVVDSFGLF